MSAVFALAGVLVLPAVPAAAADRIRDQQWQVTYLKLAEAHRITTGSGVSVAVVDTGVARHPDLARNLQRGTDVIAGGDGSGQVDQDGHGTQMAGLIAGHGSGRDAGVLGVAPGAKILPVKATATRDDGAGVGPGFEWAASQGAGVINFSSSVPMSRTLTDAVAEAVKADAVVVAPSGNRASDLVFSYPAAIPEVLAVGAVGENGEVADFSVTGEKVGICAPGVDLVTTTRNGRYAKASGTSHATALVSGAAALVRARFPELSAPEVIHRLTATADDNGPPGRDDECGAGVLNIVKALTADIPSTEPDRSSETVAQVDKGAEPTGSSLPMIAGAGAAVIVLGGLTAFLLVRKRRSAS